MSTFPMWDAWEPVLKECSRVMGVATCLPGDGQYASRHRVVPASTADVSM